MDHSERFALFIDGSNLNATIQRLELKVDYVRLLEFFQGRGRLLRAYYYTALPKRSVESDLVPFIDFLDFNGYTIVSKPTREYYDAATNERRTKGNMDMELALDMLKLAPYIDHAYLFSGDGDFCRLLGEVQDKGVRVTVVSSTHTDTLSKALQRKADEFLELQDIASEVGAEGGNLESNSSAHSSNAPRGARRGGGSYLRR